MEETNQTRRKLQTAASTRKKGGKSETAHNAALTRKLGVST